MRFIYSSGAGAGRRACVICSVAVIGLHCVAAVSAAPVELISRAGPAINTLAASSFPGAGQVSGNGRFVAFESLAGNLTLISPAQHPTGYYINVYVRDLATRQTQLVSVNRSGTLGGRGDSSHPRLSQDGHYVVFESEADDLVDGDANGASDVFVRDLWTGQTRLVSARADGQSGNGASSNPTLMPDGRYAAFESDATDLTTEDQNALADVFVCDVQTGAMRRASAGSAGEPPSDQFYSIEPSLSTNGQITAFLSSASYPALGDTNNSDQVVIRDLGSDQLTVIVAKVLQAAAQAQGLTETVPPNSSPPEISADGQFVTFKNDSWLFLYDRSTAKAVLVATNAYFSADFEDETGPFISADGQKVLYAAVLDDQLQIPTVARLGPEEFRGLLEKRSSQRVRP